MGSRLRKARLGESEQKILLSLWRLEGTAHGASIQAELEEAAGMRLSISAIHFTLIRLEEKGFVESSLSAPKPVRGGKARRVFRLLPQGRAELRRARQAMDSLWQGLDDPVATE